MKDSEPRLAPAGAGLPPAEQFITRRILLPLAEALLNRERALRLFQEEGQRSLRLARSLDRERLCERVLIPRIAGIEDSSRHWSVAMTLDHLLIVGQAIRQTVLSLGRGRVPERAVRIEDVKPDPGAGETVVERFAEWLDRAEDGLREIPLPREPRLEHPWFGPLDAGQWLKLNAVHNRIHRRQIERIAGGLGGR